MTVDRHKFVDRFIDEDDLSKHIEVNNTSIDDLYHILYKDSYLITKVGLNGEILSSISQPSLVLYMLNISKIKQGFKVLEVGTSTGWNAALLSKLVGDYGEVHTLEIDKTIAKEAESRLDKLGYTNVFVHHRDGANGLEEHKFDLIIFTVGVYDINQSLYNQLKDSGKMILILKNHGGGDTLFSFNKSNECLESEEGIPCNFVQIQGKYRLPELQSVFIESNLKIKTLFKSNVKSKPFWFGGFKTQSFFYRSAIFKSFLSIIEPSFILLSFKEDRLLNSDDVAFGVYNPDENSIAVFHDNQIKFCGNDWAISRLNSCLEKWISLGMPTLASFSVEARPKIKKRNKAKDEFLIARDESYFYFRLKDYHQ
jgi:protein-L-isoaspartate(D-aspartate) O-methyltransferase